MNTKRTPRLFLPSYVPQYVKDFWGKIFKRAKAKLFAKIPLLPEELGELGLTVFMY